MAKSKVDEAVASVLNARECNIISREYCNAVREKSNTGKYILNLCAEAKRIMKGKPFQKGDVTRIVSNVAETLGWTEKSSSVRKSELRAVLASYTRLPEAINHAINKGGQCNWHFAIALGRALKDDAKASAADAFKRAGERSKAGTKATKIERVKAALVSLYKDKKSSRYHADARKAWNCFGFDHGIGEAK